MVASALAVIRIRLPILLGLLGLALVWATPVLAIERRSGPSVSLPAGETVNDDLAIAGDTVTIGGRVAGDLYVAGGTVTILPGARIDGDVLAAGSSIVIDGVVDGNVRAAGALLQVNGTVARNITVAGAHLTLGPNAVVRGNWLSGGENTFLQGTIDGKVTAASEWLQLAGRIGRDAEVAGERLLVQPAARIGGNLTYVSDSEQPVPAGVVQGQVQRIAPPELPREERRGPDVVGAVFGLILLGGSIIVGLLVAWLFPGFFSAAQTVLERRAPLAFAAGLVTLIVVPVLAIVLMVTVLGLPLGLLGLGAYIAGWYIGWLTAATA